MSDYVSAFDWEMRFISPEEHLEEPDWTAEYEGLMDDAFGLTWSENPGLEQPDEGHGFTRKDKLIDHMLAGHDEEDLFTCPSPGCTAELTRDVLTLHTEQDTPATKLGLYRVCPMPRCSFRIHAWRKPLDELRIHIIEQHHQEGRKAYAGLLKSRGYEPVAVDIVCPLCIYASQSHEQFQVHLLGAHGGISVAELGNLGVASKRSGICAPVAKGPGELGQYAFDPSFEN
ncbi:unnamed protein product [Alternaria alternata]